MPSLSGRSALLLLVALAVVPLDGAAVSRQQAESFERKVSLITDTRPAAGAPRRTALTEDEVNSWFAYRSEPNLPDGITSPQVSLVGPGRVGGQATLDLGAIARRRSTGGWLDPWALLGGSVVVSLTGTVQARDGVGRFTLESASLGGIPVPKPVLQELLTIYSRSDERPRGVSLDDSFSLPADIRAVEVGRGVAVVVQ